MLLYGLSLNFKNFTFEINMATTEQNHVMKVVKVNFLAPQIIQLLMQAEHPITYTAGNYVMLGFSDDNLKPFSIASAPREDGLIECHIRKQSDSEWMEKLFMVAAGDTLVMQGPKPQMALQQTHEAIIFVAGGTGFAPMKAILEESIRQNIQVPISFYWGARIAEDLYMHDWMIDLSQKHPHIEYIPVISEDTEHWQGETGLVHKKMLEQHPNLSHSTIYMCGPWDMTQTAKQEFIAAGAKEERIIH